MPGHVLLLALLGAAAILTRPSAVGWTVLTWLLLWLFDPHKIRAAARVLLCAGVLALALLPWGLRNRAATGHYAWLSANGGVTLYDAQGPQARGDSDQSFLREMPELAGLGEVERDRELYRLALEQMQRDPARVLELAWIKFLRTWNPTPNVAEYRRGPAAIAGAIFTIAVLALAVIGLARYLRLHRRLFALLWLPVIYFTLVHCIFVGSLRYRIPLMPMVAITAAAAWAPTDRRATGAA